VVSIRTIFSDVPVRYRFSQLFRFFTEIDLDKNVKLVMGGSDKKKRSFRLSFNLNRPHTLSGQPEITSSPPEVTGTGGRHYGNCCGFTGKGHSLHTSSLATGLMTSLDFFFIPIGMFADQSVLCFIQLYTNESAGGASWRVVRRQIATSLAPTIDVVGPPN